MTVDASVVIVAYNSREVIGRAIESIREQTSGVSYEIVVVDNASVDGSGMFVGQQYPDVRLLHMPRNSGLSAAINAGVRAASGRYLMQLNPDCRFDGDVLATLSAYLQAHAGVGVAAPQLLNDDGSVQLSCRAFPGYSTAFFGRYSLLTRLWPGNPISKRYLMTGFDHASERDVDWASGAAMMFTRDAFGRVGGWDAGFFLFNEDVDFCKRLQETGLRVVYVPQATVYHTIGISERPTTRAIVERHCSMWRYYRKHLRRSFVQDIVTVPAIGIRCGFALVAAVAKQKGVHAAR
jgi:hypothetical protein